MSSTWTKIMLLALLLVLNVKVAGSAVGCFQHNMTFKSIIKVSGSLSTGCKILLQGSRNHIRTDSWHRLPGEMQRKHGNTITHNAQSSGTFLRKLQKIYSKNVQKLSFFFKSLNRLTSPPFINQSSYFFSLDPSFCIYIQVL